MGSPRMLSSRGKILGLVGALTSVVVLILPALTEALSPLEAVATVSLAWAVWLLARNEPAGWWVSLLGVVCYSVVFYRAKLYAEVGIQVFYFVTSIQAIWIWLRGGAEHTERPVGRVPLRWLIPSLVIAALATFGLRELLIELRGAAPFWDALTTVLSLVAHLYLMGRYVESWHLWVAVDTIYVPLYLTRNLYLTSVLYAVFWLMALNGLVNFRRLYQQQQQALSPSPSDPTSLEAAPLSSVEPEVTT